MVLFNTKDLSAKVVHEASAGWTIVDGDMKSGRIVFVTHLKRIAPSNGKEPYRRERHFYVLYETSIEEKAEARKIVEMESAHGESLQTIVGVELSPSGRYVVVRRGYWESTDFDIYDLKENNMILEKLKINGDGFLHWKGARSRDGFTERAFFFEYTSDYGYEARLSGDTIMYDLDLETLKVRKGRFPLCYPAELVEGRYLVVEVHGGGRNVFDLFEAMGEWE